MNLSELIFREKILCIKYRQLIKIVFDEKTDILGYLIEMNESK